MRLAKTDRWLAVIGSIVVLAIIWAAAPAPAARVAPKEQVPLPAGIKVTLVAGRTHYFLGENILIHYHVENIGAQLFKISLGGDYRGSTRADRFAVSATSNDGQSVPDPTPLTKNFAGGMSIAPVIKPGDEWFESIRVTRYCSFPSAGSYTIDAFHDLGLGPRKKGDPRVASLIITLQAPTETQAEAIVAEDENAAPYSGPTWGKKSETRLDYPYIRHPAFLPALFRRAQAGNRNALEGLASIPTTEATQALEDLSEHPDGGFRSLVAAKLKSRRQHSLGNLRPPATVQN